MEPFWQSMWFAEVIQWFTFVILLLLIFSPFIIMGIKRFHLARWYVVPFVYLASWFIHYSVNSYIVDLLTKPLARLNNFTDIVFGIDNAYYGTDHWLFIFWPLSVFYIIKIFRGKFTLKNILVGTGCAILIFIALVWYLLYGISQGWGFEGFLLSF